MFIFKIPFLAINQQDIANLLKISRVTVTKALQMHPDIAKSTVQKVKKVADELGYIPNSVGRNLSTNKTNTIGIVVPKINHSFFSEIIEETYIKATALGYQIILMVSFENEEVELANVKSLLSMNVDGILIDSVSTSTEGKFFSLISLHKKPVIFFDRKPRFIKKTESIVFDDFNLTFEITSRLIDKGYKDIMYISGSQLINICYNRLRGFKSAMKDSNLSVPKNRVLTVDRLDKSSGIETFEKFIRSKPKLPEVIVCVNDSIALGVYDVCKKYDLKIPDDLGVVGFGHLKISDFVQPPLSTVKLNLKKASILAIENLVALIKGKKKSTDTIIDGEVIFRGSIK